SVVSGRARTPTDRRGALMGSVGSPLTARTTSVDETRKLAAALAELAHPGALLVRGGALGAGKTAFPQGFGRGLDVDEPITSPTFTLAQQYEGRLGGHPLDVDPLAPRDDG